MRSPLVRIATALGLLLLYYFHVLAQTPNYPKEIRGYKVERAVVEMKRGQNQKTDKPAPADTNPDTLIRFGEPELARLTPLGIRLEIPIVVAPVTQKGHVDFLMFEDMVVNGTPVRIDEYHREFDLPNKDDLVLDKPLKFTVNLPNAMLGVLGEVIDSKETWLVTGRVYVFGHFKKLLFTFKRTIPVEINLKIRNPMRK